MKQTFQRGGMPWGASRPHGCSKLATAPDPRILRFAIATGNRATRRVAKRNLERLQKSGGPT